MSKGCWSRTKKTTNLKPVLKLDVAASALACKVRSALAGVGRKKCSGFGTLGKAARMERTSTLTKEVDGPVADERRSADRPAADEPPRKKEGDSVTDKGRVPPANPQLEVLLRGEDYLVVNKPADVRMDGDFDNTVAKLAWEEVKRTEDNLERFKLRFVHQLDYATSGVLCLALTRKAAGFICKQFEARTVQKTYLALVYGTLLPGSYVYDDDIAEHSENSFRMAVGTTDNPGRSARTVCTPIGYGTYLEKAVTKVRLEPSTGRRHQLRVHMLTAGFPIVGDATYASDSDGGPSDPRTPPRMFLHAWKLLVEMPLPTGLTLIETPDPFDTYVKLSETPPSHVRAVTEEAPLTAVR